MQDLLRTFDGDPEKLASAFATQLNEALEIKHKEENLKKLATTVAQNWDQLIKDYFEFYQLDGDMENFLIKDGDNALLMVKLIISMFPEVEKYLKAIDKITNMTNKCATAASNGIIEFQKKMKELSNNKNGQ